jgi:hypothetical protein
VKFPLATRLSPGAIGIQPFGFGKIKYIQWVFNQSAEGLVLCGKSHGDKDRSGRKNGCEKDQKSIDAPYAIAGLWLVFLLPPRVKLSSRQF